MRWAVSLRQMSFSGLGIESIMHKVMILNSLIRAIAMLIGFKQKASLFFRDTLLFSKGKVEITSKIDFFWLK